MPIRPLRSVLLAGIWLAAACASTAAAPPVPPPAPSSAADPAGADPAPIEAAAGPHEVALVADLGPLPDGSGRAVVTTTWTTDARGVVRFAIDTPAGLAAQHVMTEDEHWWRLSPEVRDAIADAAWVRFDLGAVERAGGALPDLVLDARKPPPRPHDIAVGEVVAGREVLAVAVVGPDEVHLTVEGIEAPVVHRRRALPASTLVEIPSDAVDVADLPDVLRW